jgi:AraC-like DNA-binding protein
MKKSYQLIHLDLSKIDKLFRVSLGKINCISAQHPMKIETHKNTLEILYFVKGNQIYNINDIDYLISSGEVLVIFPSEKHSSGKFPFDKSLMYYFHIDIDNYENNIIGYAPEEEKFILGSINKINKRIFKGNNNLKYLLDKIISTYNFKCQYKKTLLRNYISLFLINILECSKRSDDFSRFANINNVLKYIDSHIEDSIKIENLSKVANLSVSRFKTCFREQVGLPPREYILRQKIEKAKELISLKKHSITDIAYILSFSSSQYFSTVFKKFTFYSPKDFKQLKNNIKL